MNLDPLGSKFKSSARSLLQEKSALNELRADFFNWQRSFQKEPLPT